MPRVVCMADTHCAHHDLVVPLGDILIHAGDALCDGNRREFLGFIQWFAALPHPIKIYVPGNHDEFLFWNREEALALIPAGVTVLLGQGTTVDGYLEVWGAPWVPGLAPESAWRDHPTAMAFSLPETARREAWETAPGVIDILVCHAPPTAVAQADGDNLVDLAIHRACPKLVVCGHVHRARGVYREQNRRGEEFFIVNAACCGPSPDFAPLNPLVVDLDI